MEELKGGHFFKLFREYKHAVHKKGDKISEDFIFVPSSQPLRDPKTKPWSVPLDKFSLKTVQKWKYLMIEQTIY